MKKGWEIKRLEDIVSFQRGLTYSKADEVEYSENIVLRSNNVDLTTNNLDFTKLKYINPKIKIPEAKKVKKGSLIICTANGSKIHLGKVALIDKDYDFAFGGFMGQLTPLKDIEPKYLFYALTSDEYKKFINELSDGANINNLKFDDLKEFSFSLPSLSEQKRIVSILDRAFAAIDKAKTNTEKTLQNAKELFESYLRGVFEERGEGWEEKTIDDISSVVNGYSFKSKDFSTKNEIKSVKITNVGVKEFVEEDGNLLPSKFKEIYKEYKVHEGTIVIALTRTIISAGLKVAIVPKSYHDSLLNQRVAGLIPNKQILAKYLYSYLCTESVSKYVLSNVNTLMQPNLSINDLKRMTVPVPPISEQKEIIIKLDEVSSETKKLETIYQQKLNDLDELKKSILQKAFSGELTADASIYEMEAEALMTAAEPGAAYLSKSADELTGDEWLQLNFMLVNIGFHNGKTEQKYLAEVKMEKSCHFGEKIIKQLHFNRNPFKAMNGPADFDRLYKLHDFAEANGIFIYDKSASYKKYIEGENFMKFLGKAMATFRPFIKKVNELLTKLLPLNTDAIDLYATTYTAWNNLLIQGKEVNVKSIVKEGRWHQKKNRFTDKDFENAIKFLKTNGLVPDGMGKLVTEKQQVIKQRFY